MNRIHKLLALTLALLLLCTPVCATMQTVSQNTLTLSNDLRLSRLSWSNDQKKGQYLQENILSYTSGGAVRPIVVYGDTLYGRSDMAHTATYLSEQGLTLVAGVNGSFFDMNTGIPYGLVVTDGILRSSGNTPSIGFLSSGKTLIGTPELQVKLLTSGMEQELFYNKALTKDNGIGLYSRDYDTRTKNTVSAYHVILQPTGAAELSMRGSVSATVTAIQENSTSCDIPEGGFVLAVAENSVYTSALNALKALRVGDSVEISTTCDTSWASVQYACGGGELLVENGVNATDFTLDSADKFRARTAAGLKSDGTLILYTVDETESSAGLTLPLLAERMARLGCVTAINLDGGGSTMLSARYPGHTLTSTINTPSDGKARKCANFIFLVRPTTTSGSAARLHLEPFSGTNILPGADLALTTMATDANYQPTALPGTVTYSTNGGSVENGILTVASTACGAVTVSAVSGSLQTSATYTVLSDVTDITLHRAEQTAALTSLRLSGGASEALSASARLCGQDVLAENESFTWSVPEALGTVTESGVFTAANVSRLTEGILTVSYGTAKADLSITVCPTDPFADVKGHWAESMINSLYFDGVITGSEQKDGTLTYRPDASMTRQEFIVALMRCLGADLTAYRNVELPFSDRQQIASWASDAMKAAYSMGYLSGSSSGGKLYAKPLDTISRQEAMTILSRTLPADSETATDLDRQFSDADRIAAWAREPLGQMLRAGVISGSNGKLNPTGDVTRAQVAKMLYTLQ